MAFSLVIGGARSGKSAFAEELISATQADYVRYGATGPTPTNDPAWEGRGSGIDDAGLAAKTAAVAVAIARGCPPAMIRGGCSRAVEAPTLPQ
ncbi:bifunctional adenosylcobinamide kinase/adenosylcobinamide-phosphate guanylyltransferase [Lawsonella clevelandensis]|uniref:bifunctional adenosylcobinamide kinase/adenosylcobinamide-phosphate guanylyltransferase n=1 Tax=Lawsonella clevelandensis TaxID=1528099 RepID=UPI0029140CE9|nr:bifunctional adenosylcobinamide kinase/adenosylcobinamide-phosphate guanylyltransferase [Lawsonella clevelandensis]MDU7193997.1 bifunctional adenosylcobinamide kinase/adenosylcobinamide-phosphate guanylyltransferase [Lawsonella clevelandensis]